MIVRPADLSLPMPPAELFGRKAPLVFEIGFGSGSFLQHLAEEHPEWNLLGAEISLGSVRRTFRRMLRARAKHVRLYMGPAGFLLRNVIPPRSLHRVYVNFPDPWPKKRHRHRRLLKASFFELLSTRLEDGGALLFTTDHAAYLDYALEQARRTGLFRIWQSEPPEAALRTKYARRWLKQEKCIHHVHFQKAKEADQPFPPIIETYPPGTMHHAILEGRLPSIDTFSKKVHPFPGGHVILLEAARPLQETNGFFVLARIEEEELTQEVIIEARQREEDVYVGIKSFCQPLPTRGTREAVRCVTQWLVEEGLEPVVEAY